MTIPAHIAQTLADLRARREYLDQAIHVLSSIWESPAARADVSDTPAQLPAAKRRTQPERRKKPRNVSDRRDDGAAHEDAILDVIKRLGGSCRPSQLAKLFKIDLPTLRARTAGLLKSKRLIATGATSSRRLSLPGTPAKEDP